jgi:hypothetical protein
MCALVAVSMGGCAVLISGYSDSIASGLALLALLPAAIALLNIFILGGLFGWGIRWRPAFYILGIADLLIALVFLAQLIFSGVAIEAWVSTFMMPQFVVFALKGALSIHYGNKLKNVEA